VRHAHNRAAFLLQDFPCSFSSCLNGGYNQIRALASSVLLKGRPLTVWATTTAGSFLVIVPTKIS